MFSILVLLFTVIPALEIYLLFSIGGQIGGLNTLFIVLLTGVIGASLAKTQGLAILSKMQKDLEQGALPADQIIHGLLVFGGGLLLLTPGFLTDIFGLSMVFPGTRHLLAVFLKSYFQKAVASGNVQFSTFGRGGGFSYHSQGTNPYNTQEPHSREPRQVAPDTFEAEYKKK
ncbi:FxsA family protein [Halobacteriovorax sp. GB3]|uniref:FxsA family protein n=1 Tax=Halobacteriovorax sp. GB3 TaxID=2719615 RepID=UPI002361AF85|nr:FxsA family protein [Halobacteriovorax sp. GB3]MDD0851794.1 FxsA family protein [Halobacteriovorax sp. GB3]